MPPSNNQSGERRQSTGQSTDSRHATRRRLLAAAIGTTVTGFSGCIAQPDSSSTADDPAGGSPTESPGDETSNSPDESPSDSPEESPTESAGGTWPQFGADRQNSGHATDVSGPGTGEPRLAWRYDAGTPTMNASPVASEGVVYVPGSGDPGTIHAVEIESGDRVWAYEPDGFAISTPALADGTLYVGTWGKQFYALDAETGAVRWKKDIGHRFGSSSPVVTDDTVYVGTIGDGPLVVSGDDESEFEACAFLALDRESGDLRWQFRDFGERENVDASPAIADGRVFVGTENALLALDAETGTELWRRPIEAHSDSSPAVADGLVYYGGPGSPDSTSPATLWAIEAETGETVWRAGIDDINFRTSAAVADGLVYTVASSVRTCAGDDCSGTTRGQVYALDAKSGERQWTADIETDTRSSPAVADGVIYVGCNDGLSAVTTDGESVWHVAFESERDADPYVDSSPAVAAETVFVGVSDGRLRAIESAAST